MLSSNVSVTRNFARERDLTCRHNPATEMFLKQKKLLVEHLHPVENMQIPPFLYCGGLGESQTCIRYALSAHSGALWMFSRFRDAVLSR